MNENDCTAVPSDTWHWTTSTGWQEAIVIPTGWLCPRCGIINAPWKDHCYCCPVMYVGDDDEKE